jgi:hypothetical protein
MEIVAPMMVLVVFALTIGTIFRSHFVNKRLRENGKAYADLQVRLVDKFGDAAEVVRYLESESGQKLLAGATTGQGSGQARILDALQTGIISILGGVGLLAAKGVSDATVGEVMQVLGLIALLIGVGFVISALVSQSLMKSWGLLGTQKTEVGQERAE